MSEVGNKTDQNYNIEKGNKMDEINNELANYIQEKMSVGER